MAFNTLTYSILQSPFLIFVFVLICSVFFCFNKSKNSSSSSSSIVLICTVLVTTKVRYIRKSSVGETKWWAISIHERLAVSELKYLCCLAMHTCHTIKYIYIYIFSFYRSKSACPRITVLLFAWLVLLSANNGEEMVRIEKSRKQQKKLTGGKIAFQGIMFTTRS